MSKAFKFITVGLTSLVLSGAVLPPITVLAETFESVVSDSMEPVTKDGYRIFLIDGKIVEWPANMPAPTEKQIVALKQERGKWSFAAKKILKAYDKLPANIKSYINKYLGIHTIARLVDHYTGWIEDSLYKTCRDAGMPDWMARAVAKTLTLIAL